MRNSFSNSIDTDPSFGLEHVIFQELRSRGHLVNTGKLSNGEVDFVVTKWKKKDFLQIAYYLASKKTLYREYGALREIRDVSPKNVLSLDQIDSSRDGVTHLYIPDFLLGKADIHLS